MSALAGMLRKELNPLIAACLSAVVLIGTLAVMIESRATILRDGAEIVLRAGPVDPRDLLRGDYVALRYDDVSTVDRALFSGAWPDRNRYVPLWLTLTPGEDGLAVVKAVTLVKPVPGEAGAVYMKSKPLMLYKQDATQAGSAPIALKFGIERYYVPEGEGLEIEKARNEHRTTVAVRVSGSGEPQIARLMIDGETLYQEPLY